MALPQSRNPRNPRNSSLFYYRASFVAGLTPLDYNLPDLLVT